MSLKEVSKTRIERVVKSIQNSDLDDIEKAYLTDLNHHAAEGTNGLTPEQKLQNVSETVSALAELDTYGVIDRHNAAKRDKEIKATLENLSSKIDSIDTRLTANDEKTNKMTEYLTKADEIIEMYKKTIEINDGEVKKEIPSPVVIKTEESPGKTLLLVDLLKKIGWPGCVTIVGTVAIIAFRPEIITFFKNLF